MRRARGDCFECGGHAICIALRNEKSRIRTPGRARKSRSSERSGGSGGPNGQIRVVSQEAESLACCVRERSGERGRTMDDIKIKVALEFSISESDLEDALAELDEISVDSLITQILDKSVAVDDIRCKVVEGPNTLEEVDELRSAASHPS
jgi:hypothetical protein